MCYAAAGCCTRVSGVSGLIGRDAARGRHDENSVSAAAAMMQLCSGSGCEGRVGCFTRDTCSL